jgi:hypothetical protein
MSCCNDFISRTYAARSRERRKYFPVGLMTTFPTANTSFTSYASPTLRKSYIVKNPFVLSNGAKQS